MFSNDRSQNANKRAASELSPNQPKKLRYSMAEEDVLQEYYNELRDAEEANVWYWNDLQREELERSELMQLQHSMEEELIENNDELELDAPMIYIYCFQCSDYLYNSQFTTCDECNDVFICRSEEFMEYVEMWTVLRTCRNPHCEESYMALYFDDRCPLCFARGVAAA